MPRKPPQYIAIDGIDGSGKTTQIRMLQTYLQQNGYTSIRVGEPTYGRYGRAIRMLMQRATAPPVQEQRRLFTLDRRDHVATTLRPLIEFVARHRRFIVVQDRSYLSSAAYQAQGFSVKELNDLLAEQENFAPRPDVFVLLDIAVDVALRRLEARPAFHVWLESAETLKAARKRYRMVARMKPAEVRTVNASGDVDRVHRKVLRALQFV